MVKKATPKPTKKAEKACYDLLHRAWLAGVIGDFRYGTARNSYAVEPADASSELGWTVDRDWLPLTETASVVEQVGELLTLHGIVAVEWGPSWCGCRRVKITRRLAAVA